MYFYCKNYDKCGEVVKRKIAYPISECIKCKQERWKARSKKAYQSKKLNKN